MSATLSPSLDDDTRQVRMMPSLHAASRRPLRIGICSTYAPRACGLATFAEDLRAALIDVPNVATVALFVLDDGSAVPVLDDGSALPVQSITTGWSGTPGGLSITTTRPRTAPPRSRRTRPAT